MADYVVYDVFTEQPFGGNQLAVFPDARAIPDAQLQQITREFNFSEVTFVYPPEDPAHTAKVRIFTPTTEVDFAGHPTIGTAVALAQTGVTSPMVLELGVAARAIRCMRACSPPWMTCQKIPQPAALRPRSQRFCLKSRARPAASPFIRAWTWGGPH